MLFALAPADSDVSQFQAPGPLQFVYYLLRPLRLFSKRQSEAVQFPPRHEIK
jgi:hypothetical protein